MVTIYHVINDYNKATLGKRDIFVQVHIFTSLLNNNKPFSHNRAAFYLAPTMSHIVRRLAKIENEGYPDPTFLVPSIDIVSHK